MGLRVLLPMQSAASWVMSAFFRGRPLPTEFTGVANSWPETLSSNERPCIWNTIVQIASGYGKQPAADNGALSLCSISMLVSDVLVLQGPQQSRVDCLCDVMAGAIMQSLAAARMIAHAGHHICLSLLNWHCNYTLLKCPSNIGRVWQCAALAASAVAVDRV